MHGVYCSFYPLREIDSIHKVHLNLKQMILGYVLKIVQAKISLFGSGSTCTELIVTFVSPEGLWCEEILS